MTPAPVSNPAEIEAALSSFARAPNGGLVLLPSPLVTLHREGIAAAALRHRLPSIYLARLYAASGGLMTYGPVISEPYRQAATYVDRILKGAKPGELPVQAASKFEMVINLKTATALGVTVPPTMLGRADEVIEYRAVPCCDCSQPLLAHRDKFRSSDSTSAFGELRKWIDGRSRPVTTRLTQSGHRLLRIAATQQTIDPISLGANS